MEKTSVNTDLTLGEPGEQQALDRDANTAALVYVSCGAWCRPQNLVTRFAQCFGTRAECLGAGCLGAGRRFAAVRLAVLTRAVTDGRGVLWLRDIFETGFERCLAADARVRRRAAAHPGLFTCRPRPSARALAGTFSVITEPAPM